MISVIDPSQPSPTSNEDTDKQIALLTKLYQNMKAGATYAGNKAYNAGKFVVKSTATVVTGHAIAMLFTEFLSRNGDDIVDMLNIKDKATNYVLKIFLEGLASITENEYWKLTKYGFNRFFHNATYALTTFVAKNKAWILKHLVTNPTATLAAGVGLGLEVVGVQLRAMIQEYFHQSVKTLTEK